MIDLANARTKYPEFSDAAWTASLIPDLPLGSKHRAKDLKDAAKAAGMKPERDVPNAYRAPDDSWVLMELSGRVHRGYDAGGVQYRISSMPGLPLQHMQKVRYTSLRKDVALGEVKFDLRADSAQWLVALDAAGFVADPGNPHLFRHPSEPGGSWALVIRDAVQGDQLHVGSGKREVRLETLPLGAGDAFFQWDPDSGQPIELQRAQQRSTRGAHGLGTLLAFGVQLGSAQGGRPYRERVANAVTALGVPFRTVGPDQYLFEDGSWAMVTSTGGRSALVRGLRQADGTLVRFIGEAPTSLRTAPLVVPGRLPDTLSVARLPPAGEDLGAYLNLLVKAHGFLPDPQGLPYVHHPDGGWVAVMDGEVFRGWRTGRVEDASFAPADQLPQAQLPTSAAPRELPARATWTQWKLTHGYRVAWLPYTPSSGLTNENLRTILSFLGFQETRPQHWVHADSSELTEDGRGCIQSSSIRFCNRPFGEFPYQNQLHASWLVSELARWQQWLRGSGPAPTDDPAWCGVVLKTP